MPSAAQLCDFGLVANDKVILLEVRLQRRQNSGLLSISAQSSSSSSSSASPLANSDSAAVDSTAASEAPKEEPKDDEADDAKSPRALRKPSEVRGGAHAKAQATAASTTTTWGPRGPLKSPQRALLGQTRSLRGAESAGEKKRPELPHKNATVLAQKFNPEYAQSNSTYSYS